VPHSAVLNIPGLAGDFSFPGLQGAASGELLMIVILVGMPGSGKSTAGRHLARRLNLPFVDSDAVIEERIGMPIRAYFDAHGEAAFRDLESQVLAEICAGDGCVLATGGGSVLRPGNRAVLKDKGVVMYLRASPDQLYRRLKNDTKRPLLQVADPLQVLRDLYAVRDPLYRETAHYVIETGRPSLAMLVNKILMQIDMLG
jgi:shikimate kinase